MVHDFEPILVRFGPFAVSWYSLLYTAGTALIYGFFVFQARRHVISLSARELRAYLVSLAVAALVGARLVHVLCFQPDYFLRHVVEIPQYWRGGLAQHGAIFGMIAVTFLFARRHGKNGFQLLDTLFLVYPIAIFLGRLGNFINGELWGRVASPDFPLGVVFPNAGHLPRHPSQLYEALGEGTILFIVVWIAHGIARNEKRLPGLVTLTFIVGYALIRGVIELWREPDGELARLTTVVSTGQLLCLALLVLALVLRNFRRRAVLNPS